MSRELRMPSLGADMEAATLVQWNVRPGDRVRHGSVVAAVETEKGVIDIEAFDEGIVERLVVEPGARVAVGAPLALLEGEAAGMPAAPAAASAALAPAVASPPSSVPSPQPALQPPPQAARRGHPVSPAARARAAGLGVDLAQVRGSGPRGAVTLQDVEAAAAAAPVAARDARQAMRGAIAASMSRSKREIPHYYLQLALDFGPAQKWLEVYNAERPVPERILPAALLVKATARVAAELPGFNGRYGARGFEPSAAVHAGVAIALRGGGLVAPAVMDAAAKPLDVLMRDLAALAGRVRAGRMRSGEFAAATITVNSLGEEGVDTLLPIIQPPQVAIVAFGSVLERPWVVAGRVEVRPVMNVALAADHRVTDGRDGARFLARIRDRLAAPEELLA
ncbi:MAG: dihydrolipoamide acetyltransferase family protein [Steroidobacteraceae bacterium]